jgi:phage shock protein A
MATAMSILSGGQKTFEASANTFLQLRSVRKHQTDLNLKAKKASNMLRILAGSSKSIEVARMAVLVQSGGHFDKVIGMIDMMITDLRAEEAEDIAHRDLCENNQNANSNELADLEHEIEKTKEALGRMENTKGELESEISQLEDDIAATKKAQADLLEFRNKEVKEFRQALKDDTDAIELMNQAIASLTKFYKDNNLPLALAQAPEYAKDPDKAPAVFEGDYGGRKSESTGILAILGMLVEDAQKEIAEGRDDDADAQAKYEKQNGALQETLDAQDETKATVEKEKADLEQKMSAFEKYKKGKTDDQSAEGDTQKAIGTDCAWVKEHFDSRREKRQTEVQGLVDAKAFLAGGGDGIEPL